MVAVKAARAPVRDVLPRVSWVMLPAAALLALTYFVLPRIDLSGPLAVAAYWTAESGGKGGIPVIGVALTALLVSRPGVPWKLRAAEAGAVVLVLAALLGGGAYLNEHVVKPALAVPRPNILELAETSTLKMSAREFYALPEQERGEHLRAVLTPQVGLDPRVREHWISESGYSFPSGHSFSSMLFATFFLSMGLTCFSGRRLWVFYLLPLWAVAVCLSRPILRVHSPTDVCTGALEGIVVGGVAFVIVRRILAGRARNTPDGR